MKKSCSSITNENFPLYRAKGISRVHGRLIGADPRREAVKVLRRISDILQANANEPVYIAEQGARTGPVRCVPPRRGSVMTWTLCGLGSARDLRRNATGHSTRDQAGIFATCPARLFSVQRFRGFADALGHAAVLDHGHDHVQIAQPETATNPVYRPHRNIHSQIGIVLFSNRTFQLPTEGAWSRRCACKDPAMSSRRTFLLGMTMSCVIFVERPCCRAAAPALIMFRSQTFCFATWLDILFRYINFNIIQLLLYARRVVSPKERSSELRRDRLAHAAPLDEQLGAKRRACRREQYRFRGYRRRGLRSPGNAERGPTAAGRKRGHGELAEYDTQATGLCGGPDLLNRTR
jgi:hypothetical protein